ncbi:nucleoside/nucleotide kinase family protein [Hespellia stercorisuis]|uniref:Guanylate kinase n=1 Tax=Hespellia stercorisuis DSM 15480 TaxID=1121950 RepID=A0A1M6JE78_9FIRM|nr:guanylate kinase [Hespellia stercorisuis]SHJ44950.1 Guanylate kinase [Hespellia stercorisuis DSM 15480]
MSKIYYIMGKSSSGKDTIFKELVKRFPACRTIVLYTTRPIRAGETEGVEYHFVGEEALQKLEQAGRVIELRAYNTKHGIWKYFTADDGQIDLQSADYLVIGTLESFRKMCRFYGVDALVPVYIEVEDGLRLERALARERQQEQPKYAEMCRRFLADCEDFSEENIVAAGIGKRFQNVDISECLSEIEVYLRGKM